MSELCVSTDALQLTEAASKSALATSLSGGPPRDGIMVSCAANGRLASDSASSCSALTRNATSAFTDWRRPSVVAGAPLPA